MTDLGFIMLLTAVRMVAVPGPFELVTLVVVFLILVMLVRIGIASIRRAVKDAVKEAVHEALEERDRSESDT
ncbi:MAG: hypothetical protein ABIH23_00730 [bacterium]